MYKERPSANSHWAVVELLSSDEKKNCSSVVGLVDLSCVIVVRGIIKDNGCWSDDASSNERSRRNWFLLDDFSFEQFTLIPICFVADGTIKDGINVERLKLAGKSKNDDEEEDVVEAGDIGVNVSDDDDEHVEFVGLGHILGEFGGGNKSISGCWIGWKCVLSLPFVVDEEDDKDGGIEERRLSDCCVVSKFVLDSIRPGDGDSLEDRERFQKRNLTDD